MSKKITATLLEEPKGPRIAWQWDKDHPHWNDVLEAGKDNIVGGRFRKTEKIWTAPATVDNCYGLRKAFGKNLVILPPLAEWFRLALAETERAVAGTAATDAELSVLPEAAPRLYATLRPDQRAGIALIAEPFRDALLVADKPGLGKTLQVVGGIIEADIKGNILVVCPKISVWNVWRREIKKWTDETVYVARGTRAKREEAINAFIEDGSERKWLVVVAEMLRVNRKPNETTVKANAKKRGRIESFVFPELFGIDSEDGERFGHYDEEGNFVYFGWDAVIADESQRLLGSLTVAKSNLAGEGLSQLPCNLGSRRYAVSATPFGKGGRAQGMFGTLHWLWPDEYTSFWRWAGQWFKIEEEYVRRGQTAKKIVGLREGVTAEGFLATLGPRILRRTKEEVLPNLPPKQFVEVLCEMEPKQRSQYQQLNDDAEVNVEGGVIIANGVLPELTRAKQIANGVLVKRGDQVRFSGESCKLDAFMEKAEARGLLDGSGDTKVIISSRYNAFLEDVVIPRLEKEQVAYHLLTGKTSDRKRDEAMDEFQGEGGPRVFILNSKAGGVSITLDAADEVHCFDELDNPEDNEQLEDRAHRASRIHQVTIFYYRTEGTIDVNTGETVEAKRKVQFEILDGRRGLADVRNWIKYRPPGKDNE